MANKLLGVVGNLLPTFKRNRMLDDLAQTRRDLTMNIIPTLLSVSRSMGNRLASAPAKGYEANYFRTIGIVNSRGIISDLHSRMESLDKVIGDLNTLIENSFEQTVVLTVITVPRANVVRAIDAIYYVTRNVLRVVNYLVVNEQAHYRKDPNYVKQTLSKSDIMDVTAGSADFAQCLRALTINTDFVARLKDLEPIVVSQQTDAAISTMRSAAIDPNNLFGLNNALQTPLYRISMTIAEWQDARYEETRELKTLLELRLIQLENEKKYSSDEGIDREIESTSRRAEECARKIAAYEGDLK